MTSSGCGLRGVWVRAKGLKTRQGSDVLLEVCNLSTEFFTNIYFPLRADEVIGVTRRIGAESREYIAFACY